MTMTGSVTFERRAGRLAKFCALAFLTTACPKKVGVSRHEAASIDAEEAQQILSDAWTVLDTEDAAGDVRCNVQALRELSPGDVRHFAVGSGLINGKADYDAVFAEPGFVKIVNGINWCGKISANVLGCSPTPGNGMVVVRHTPAEEGILWAHEYGHTRGNAHVAVPTRVMNPFVFGGARAVTADECANYRD